MKRPAQSASTRPSMTSAIEAAAADWVTRVDAGLTKEEQQIFQDWLSADPRHADAFDRLTEAWSVFDRVQERGAASAILDALAQRSRARRARRVQAGVAAGLVLAAGLAYFQWRAPAPVAAPGSPARLVQVVAPDPVRKLPDGSIVELNTGAEIEVKYSADARHVKLVRGEAFFRVEKDPARPFFVEANGVVVRAVGTAFTVQMQSAAVEVVVKEGAVDVGRAPATGTAATQPPADSVRVKAGNSVRVPFMLLRPARPMVAKQAPAQVETLAQPEPLSAQQMDERLAWRIPRIEFEGTALGEAVERMNRHNRLQLQLAGGQLPTFRLSGTFRTDNPEGFVRMLEQTDVARAERQGDDLIVLHPVR